MKIILFLILYVSSKRHYSQRQNENVIELSYDLNDKFNSNKALVIAHGLFASKASWRALARRINEKTGHKVRCIVCIID
jgi:hypothetical protein